MDEVTATRAEQSAHTPGPYELLCEKPDQVSMNLHMHTCWQIVAPGNIQGIAVVIAPNEDCTPEVMSERIETARFICRACNSHDDLLAALRDIEALLMIVRERPHALAIGMLPALVGVRDAIAKAEGQ